MSARADLPLAVRLHLQRVEDDCPGGEACRVHDEGETAIIAYGAAEYRRGVEAAIETVEIALLLGVGPEMIRKEIVAALRALLPPAGPPA